MPRNDEIAADIQGLSNLHTIELRQRWNVLFKCVSNARISRDLLIRAIAWRLQADAQGGLSKAAQRQIVRHAKEVKSLGSVSVSSVTDHKTGTRLMREWQGRVHQVVVVDNGYIWMGKRYQSLSAIARAITGTRWSGPRFFGTDEKQKGVGHG